MDTTSGRARAVDRRSFLRLGGAALGAVAAGPALVSCGGGSSGSSKDVTFASAKFVGSKSMQQFVDRYNESQSKYRVTVRELPPPSSSTEVHQQLVQSLARKDGSVDVFTQDIIWIAEFANAGWAMSLDKEIDGSARKDYFPGLVEACTWQGKLTALPWYVDAGQLYYRKDLLGDEDPPTSWDALVTEAKALQGGKARFGFLWQAKQAEVLVCNLVEYVASNGGRILGEDGRKVELTDPKAVEAVRFMYDLIAKDKVTPKDVLSWDEEPSRRPFTSGQAAFLRQWSYVYGVAQDEKQSKVVDKVGVVPLPSFAGGESAACLGGYQLGVSAGSKNKEGALDFVRWMSSQETQLRYALEFGSAPTRTSVYDDAKLKKEQTPMARLKAVFEGGTPRPVTPKYPQVSLALQSHVSKALVSGDVEGSLSACARQIEQIVGE